MPQVPKHKLVSRVSYQEHGKQLGYQFGVDSIHRRRQNNESEQYAFSVSLNCALQDGRNRATNFAAVFCAGDAVG